MPYFAYKAKSSENKIVEDQQFAGTIGELADKLKAEGLIPLKIWESQKITETKVKQGKRKAKRKKPFLEIGKPVIEELIMFCRQMQAMLHAGVPILNAVKITAQTINNNRLKYALEDVIDDLDEGHSFTNSMKKHKELFPTLFLALLEVGENTGNLDEIFIQISKYLEVDRNSSKKTKEAMRYPKIIMLTIAGAVVASSMLVIPTFKTLFKNLGAEKSLPAVTVFLVHLSDFMLNYWYLVLIGFFALSLMFKYFYKTPEGKVLVDRLKLKIFALGPITHKAVIGRFCRCFATMYKSGVPLLDVLKVSAKVTDNAYIEKEIMKMRSHVEMGESLATAAKKVKVFNSLVLQMITIGDESGDIETMLFEVAKHYEEDVEFDLKQLSSIIEPVMILVMSGMALVLMLGIFLPIWDLSSIAYAHN